jgi:START domain-containing protein
MKPTTKINYLLTILTLVLVMNKSGFAQQECVLKKDKDNIKVYSCTSADSKYRAVRADFELDASIAEYMAVVLDVDSYQAWHYRAVNPRLLKRLNDTELIYYTQISAPWPVSNRDMILHLKLQMNEQRDALTVTLESIADYLPEVNDVVRIPKSYSTMTLTANQNSGLNVEYFIQVDPGGQIPAWVVNLVSTQAPYETFRNLRNRLEQLRNSTASTTSAIVN